MSTRPVAALKTCGRVALLPTGCRPTVPYLRAMAFCVIWSADCLLLIAFCGEVWETRSVFQVGCGQAEDPEGRPSARCHQAIRRLSMAPAALRSWGEPSENRRCSRESSGERSLCAIIAQWDGHSWGPSCSGLS